MKQPVWRVDSFARRVGTITVIITCRPVPRVTNYTAPFTRRTVVHVVIHFVQPIQQAVRGVAIFSVHLITSPARPVVTHVVTMMLLLVMAVAGITVRRRQRPVKCVQARSLNHISTPVKRVRDWCVRAIGRLVQNAVRRHATTISKSV